MKNLLKRIDLSYVYAFLGEATLALTFILYILLGRFLGPERYGIFTSANALAGILTFFVIFGFSDLLSREVAADPQKGLKSLTTFLCIESLNCLIVLLCLFPIARALGFEGNEIIVCYLVVLAGGFRCTKLTMRAALRGLGRFRSETISVAIERSALFLVAIAVLTLTQSLIWVVAAMALVRCLDSIGLFFYIKRKESIASPITLKRVGHSFKMAYPFAISGVLWVLYYQVDMLMLKALAPSQQAGFYGAAFGLIEIFSALPRVIFYVSFPRLTRCYAQTPEQLPTKIRQAALLLLAGVLPFVTLAGFGQTLLIQATYGDAFLPAVGALSLLLPSLSMKMFGSLVSYTFQSIRKEKLLPFILLATVCINVIANAILIPQLGAVGAALATLISEISFASVGLLLFIRVGYQQVGVILLCVAIMGLLIASIPSLLLYGLNPYVSVGLLAASLGAITWLMRRRMSPVVLPVSPSDLVNRI